MTSRLISEPSSALLEGKSSEADQAAGSDSTATIKDPVALGDIKLEVSGDSEARRALTAEEMEQSKRDRQEIEYFIVR